MNNRNFSYKGGQAPYQNAAPYNPNYGFQPNSGYQPRQVQSYGNRQAKKHSGCSVKANDDGSYCVSGWKTAQGQMIKLYARPYKGTKEVVSQNGKRWANYFVTLTNVTTLQVTNTSGLINLDNKKLYISELNLVANPKAPNGGYFGKQISKTYNR